MKMETNYSPAEALMRAALQHPTRPSLIEASTGRVLSVSDSADLVRRTVTFLRCHGVERSDCIFVIAANSPWHFILHVAASWIHAVTVPLSPRLPAERLAALQADLAPSLVVIDDSVAPEALRVQGDGLQASGKVFTIDRIRDAVDGSSPQTGEPNRCAHEVGAVVMTSGSSGHSQPVELTHAQLWWASQNFRDGFEYSPGRDVVGVCAPMSHIGGFNGTSLDTFSHGGTVVIIERFHPREVLRAIEHYSINMMFLVPVMCVRLLEAYHTTNVDISSFHKPLVGGDTLTPRLAHQMRSVGLNPIHVWGMTETGGAGAMLPADMSCADGSIGRPFPYVELQIDGQEYEEDFIDAPHPVGQILVRGPNVVSEDTWLRTGDLAYLDDAGRIHIVGRASRMINTAGELVAPGPIERALMEIPGVDQAVVLGVEDDTWGHVIAAVVKWSGSGHAPELNDIRAYLSQSFAPWEHVRQIRYVDTIFVNPNGKPDIARLHELFT